MTTTHPEPRRAGTALTLLGGMLLAGAAVYGLFLREEPASSGSEATASQYSLPKEEIAAREKIYLEAEKQGAQMAAAWPKTEEETISAFWAAITAGDIAKACIYCPGAKPDDFGMYAKWRPSAPTSIGAPEAHPTEKGVMLRPVVLSFPGYPNKTVKMALMKTSDGRIAIDGRWTIWW